ncbi:outer membrane protein assembly factor BamD [Sphingomonas sp. RHCKR47]|uniref:tetratricopeptide repeat protein n=1 Tax=Sphingomonas citricola TaxID=2862498 RepID=UPI001CA4C7EF|nr:tetratricopeptide repeat protein [Sphingomonas citricola]MBW6521919.1 outer membrane protein assembly factor BamD [Sphingomonas citricola]
MSRYRLGTGGVLAAAALVSAAAPAVAQSNVEGRVGKLESEMRAVQRKVFPGGAAAMVEPQIAPETAASVPNGVPATSPVADLTNRVTALEQQMATMTGQIEQAQYRLRQLEDQFTAYKKATDARLSAAPPATADAGDPAIPPPSRGAVRAAGDTTPGKAADARGEASEPVRAAAAAGVEKPSTGDAAEDAYTYGYRLYTAKKYPEAEAQLKQVVATYPKHRRASFAQNLLGRAYLDEGKPSLASIAFYDNYKKFPEGERAPDSLYYLGQSLTKLNKPADACKVYGELTDVYGDKISATMKADIARARVTAKCK